MKDLDENPRKTIKLQGDNGNMREYSAQAVKSDKKLLQSYIESRLQSKLLEFQKKIEKSLFLLLRNRLEAEQEGLHISKYKFDATSSRMFHSYESLFDPENHLTSLSISTKRVIAEEVLTLPLTAFLVGKLADALKATKWVIQASKISQL